MIIHDKVDVSISYRNISYYKNKGYDANIKDTIKVSVNDLPRYSRTKVDIKCSNCGKTRTMTYTKYMDNFDRYGFYTCKKCSTIKKEITFKNNYGVSNPMKLDNIKEKGKLTKIEKYGDENYNNMDKYKETCMERYGTEYALQSDIVRDKIKSTTKELYGVDHVSHNKDIIERIINKGIKTRFKQSVDLYKDKYNIDIIDRTENGFLVKCEDCGNNYNISGNQLQLRILYNSQLCTICNPLGINNTSQPEKSMIDFIKENYNGDIITNSKKIISPYELDVYLPDKNIAFEFNGLFWHNELNKDRDYHKIKSDLCDNIGIQLIHIYEDDWNYKQNIVKSMILNKIGVTPNKIYARKCKIEEITNNKIIRKFLDDNHIQGYVGSKIKVGLIYEEELVSLMTFGELRKVMNLESIDNSYELIRFCNKLNTNVIGGASKLFKYFINNYQPEYISSYADRGYSNGKLYEVLGFKLEGLTPPNHHYIVDGVRKHRFNFRKSNLVKDGYDANKTAKQIMLDRNIYKIYNSGNFKYIYENK